MDTKLQRVLVEVNFVYDPKEGESPLEGSQLRRYVLDEVEEGNFTVVKSVVEDYKGFEDSAYTPIWCTPKGCAGCDERVSCLRRPLPLEDPK